MTTYSTLFFVFLLLLFRSFLNDFLTLRNPYKIIKVEKIKLMMGSSLHKFSSYSIMTVVMTIISANTDEINELIAV